MGWKVCRYSCVGTVASGDPTAPATRWWNHLWLLLFRWKKITIFSVPESAHLYVVGYKPFKGDAMMMDTYLHEREFAVRNGREDCTFFAIGSDGAEVPLTIVKQTDMMDPKVHHIRLI